MGGDKYRGYWRSGYRSVMEHLPSTHKALGLIHTTTKKGVNRGAKVSVLMELMPQEALKLSTALSCSRYNEAKRRELKRPSPLPGLEMG